jgi:hypothetical protein
MKNLWRAAPDNSLMHVSICAVYPLLVSKFNQLLNAYKFKEILQCQISRKTVERLQ